MNLFVYGTLMRKMGGDKRLGPNRTYMGEAIAAGKIYNSGWYPCLKLIGDEPVFGEVWTIEDDDSVKAAINNYEGCIPFVEGESEEDRNAKLRNNLYNLVETEVMVGDELLTVYVYEYNRDVSNMRQVESGDYTEV